MPIQVENVREAFSLQKNQTIKCLVAGPPGSGKTRTASTWPNPIYADAEGRMLSVRDRDVRRVHIGSIADIEELKATLDQRPETRAQILKGPVDTVVIDTVDEVARIIVRERLRSERKESMAISDWGYLGDTLRAILRGFRNLDDLNVIFNVHLKSEEDSETGRVRYKAAIQGAVGDQIAEFVDECFLLVARPTVDPITGERIVTRYMQTYPDLQHDWVKDHSGALPQEFPLNFNDDYQRLAGLIFAENIPAPSNGTTPQPQVEVAPAEPTPRKKAAPARGRQPNPSTVTVPLPEEDVVSTGRAATVVDGVEVAPEPLVATPEALEEPADETPAEAEVPVVPDVGTEATSADPLAELGQIFRCDECGKPVEDRNYQDLSMIRFGKPLCRTHFVARNKR